MDALIQYLLAAEKEGGGHFCRIGIIQQTILYAPLQSITFAFAPPRNQYAFVIYLYREGPTLSPGTVKLEIYASGIQIQGQPLTAVDMVDPFSVWLVVTATSPSVTVATNLTGLVIEEEFRQEILIVDTEDDWKSLQKVIIDWYSNEGLKASMESFNQRRVS